MTTPREALAATLTPMLPTDWRIVTSEEDLNVLNKPVVILKQQRFARLPEAPMATHLVDFVITVVSPLDDHVKAEDQLDANVNLLVHQIDAKGIDWTSAEKVQYADRYLAYDITVQLESTKE